MTTKLSVSNLIEALWNNYKKYKIRELSFISNGQYDIAPKLFFVEEQDSISTHALMYIVKNG